MKSRRSRGTTKILAATMIRAETEAGPSIASGSHA